ncbi:MAG TPA: hypothetical protein VHC44_10395 [Verrucomicrobiae bacterium]|nr:hypothetical protein [Verrucomicrobiae bacterium]
MNSAFDDSLSPVSHVSKMGATDSTPVLLYSPRQICVATLIGSPVAACWCFAQNFRQLAQPEVAKKWLLWGCGSSFLALLVLCALPLTRGVPNYVIPIAYSIAFREVAKRIHGDIVRQHISAGGRLVSWWYVIGISFIFFIVVAVLLLVMLATFL